MPAGIVELGTVGDLLGCGFCGLIHYVSDMV